jgi:SurA N-terminal domain
VTTAKLRRPGLFAVLFALVATLTACGSGPSQINSAVIIDGSTVSVDEVQDLVQKIVREQPAARPLAQQRKLDLVAREAVSQLVLHELVTKAAADEGISLSPADLNDAMAQNPFAEELPTDGSVPPDALATQLVYRARDAREAVSDQLLMAQLAVKYYQRLVVTMDYTVVAGDQTGADPESMREQAEAKAREFAANPDQVAGLIAEDAANSIDAQEGAEFPALQSPELAATVMFGAGEGTVVAFEPSAGQALWVVGVIRDRDTDAQPQVAEPPQVGPEQLAAVGKRMLQPTAEETSIEVSPRYGVWDMSAMGVAPSEDETAGLVLPASSATP